MGLTYEEFAPGAVHEMPGRCVTEADISAFAELTGDYNPLHVDAAYAAACGYGSIITHGPMIVGIAFGLASPLLNGTVIGLLDIAWSFKRAVWPGDTVSARVEVRDKRPSRQADRGVVELALEIFNQRREVVQTATAKVLVRRQHSQGLG